MERDVNGVARALHDGISQDLVALAYRLEILALSPGLSPVQIREIRTASHDAREMTKTVRDHIYLLRSLKPENLQESLQRLQGECETAVTLVSLPEITVVPEALLNPITEVVTELVRNADKHARANRIEVEISIEENHLLVKVSDDGQGGVIEREGHFGLQGIREIAQNFNGEFSIIEDHGTQAWVSFPVSPS